MLHSCHAPKDKKFFYLCNVAVSRHFPAIVLSRSRLSLMPKNEANLKQMLERLNRQR